MFINFYPLNPNLNFLAVIRSNKEKMFKVLKSVIFNLTLLLFSFILMTSMFDTAVWP